MKLRSKIFLRIIILAVIMGCCFKFAISDALAQDLIRIDFGLPAGKNEPLLVAEAKGYFRAEGLDVRWQSFSSGFEAGESILAGRAMMGYTGDFPSLRLFEASKKGVVLVSPLEADDKLYVLVTKAEIKSAADLRGKTIATREGTIPHYFLVKYLEKNGLHVSDIVLKNMEAPEMPPALHKGDIDGFTMWQPFGIQAGRISGDKVHILSTAEGYIRGYLCILASREFAERNSDLVLRFLRAVEKSVSYTQSHKKEASELFAKKYGVEQEMAFFLTESVDFDMTFNKRFVDDFNESSKFMMSMGYLKEPIDWSRFVNLKALSQLNPKFIQYQVP